MLRDPGVERARLRVAFTRRLMSSALCRSGAGAPNRIDSG
jgi:hypothetical protein